MVTKTPIYDPCGGALSLDFTNSTGRGPQGIVNERLVDYGALLTWCVEAGSLAKTQAASLRKGAEARARAAGAVHSRALDLREAIFAAFHADLHGKRPPEPALETINAELSKALSHARLERGAKDFAWTWSSAPDQLDAPLWPIARAAAELLVSPERELVKECACEGCLWIFVDRSRNHGRRWCDMKNCGNLSKVRRHRERKRAKKSD